MRRTRQQQPRNQAVTVKFSSSEKAAVQAAATRRHVSLGAYVAEVALAAAEGRTVPVHDTERQLLGELMPVGTLLNACWGQLYEAMKRQEAAGVPEPDLKSILARIEQSADKADEVMLKVARLLPSLRRKAAARGAKGLPVHILVPPESPVRGARRSLVPWVIQLALSGVFMRWTDGMS
jgi:hypothetical protein